MSCCFFRKGYLPKPVHSVVQSSDYDKHTWFSVIHYSPFYQGCVDCTFITAHKTYH